MITNRLTILTGLVADPTDGFYTVEVGSVSADVAEVVRKCAEAPLIKHRVEHGTMPGFWGDNNVSAATIGVLSYQPALAINKIAVVDGVLTVRIKPVGPDAEKLRTRLESSTPITMVTLIDERTLGVYVMKW